MKNIQKIPLCLFTMAAISTWNTAFAAELEVDFIDGASFAGIVTGGVNFNGSGNADFTGSATGDVKISAGNVRVASATPLGLNVIMNGGSLEATTAMSLPAMAINANSTLTADAAASLTSLSGTAKLTVAGVGAVTPADLSRATNAVDVSGIVHVGATGSLLPSGAVTVKNAGLVKLMGVVPDCVPGAMKVESGGILEVAASLEVPAAGVAASGDLFGSLRFDTGSKLSLRGGANWRRPVVIGSYS
jgi:hypothetical protein